MKTALYYEQLDDGKVRCLLCPHNCTVKEGQPGTCGVRKNLGGVLYSETFNRIAALNYDPVEKKPLYHFHPGSSILSIGSVGCNLKCSFCQNCSISQATVETYPWFRNYPVGDLIDMAADKPGSIGIAFTYNEPTVYYEYMLEIAEEAKLRNLRTVMVSNGFINPEPLKRLLPVMDAFNIDLKAFRNDFYKKQTKSSLAPVLDTLKIIRKYGRHLELTNLVIPTLNDDEPVFREMAGWIGSELGKDSILHISRYFPHNRMKTGSTPVSTLKKLYEAAGEVLDFVYMGNVTTAEGQDTLCPGCGSVLISRSGYEVAVTGLTPGGKCRQCGHELANLVI